MEGLLSFNIVQDPLLYGMDAASLLAVLYLVLRPMSRVCPVRQTSARRCRQHPRYLGPRLAVHGADCGGGWGGHGSADAVDL
jgi:hypothetical protein